MNSVFSLIVVSTILSVVSAKATPAPAPPTPPPPAAANPELVGSCCAPGRCNTYTPVPATDCASYIGEDGTTMNTANWGECKTAAGCVDAKNSCGGYSVGDYVPGEVCSASSKSYLCCVPGNQDSKGCSSGKNPTGEGFNSADWLECKYEKGCTEAGNQCGGFETAGVWTLASDLAPDKKVDCPKGTGRAEGEIGCSTANAPGSKGLSTIVILVLVAGAVLVVGGAIYFSSKSSKPAEDPSMQYQLEKGDATVEHNSL